MDSKKKKKCLILLVDGFNGILALMIYNFSLYLLGILNNFLMRMREQTGYFYIKTFMVFGFKKSTIILSVILLFLFAALLGIIIAKLIRKARKVEF